MAEEKLSIEDRKALNEQKRREQRKAMREKIAAARQAAQKVESQPEDWEAAQEIVYQGPIDAVEEPVAPSPVASTSELLPLKEASTSTDSLNLTQWASDLKQSLSRSVRSQGKQKAESDSDSGLDLDEELASAANRSGLGLSSDEDDQFMLQDVEHTVQMPWQERSPLSSLPNQALLSPALSYSSSDEESFDLSLDSFSPARPSSFTASRLSISSATSSLSSAMSSSRGSDGLLGPPIQAKAKLKRPATDVFTSSPRRNIPTPTKIAKPPSVTSTRPSSGLPTPRKSIVPTRAKHSSTSSTSSMTSIASPTRPARPSIAPPSASRRYSIRNEPGDSSARVSLGRRQSLAGNGFVGVTKGSDFSKGLQVSGSSRRALG